MHGRAGRENLPGKVIIQTYNPDNYSIEYAKNQDYDSFYKTEIEVRSHLNYPPFCDIIQIGITSTNEEEILNVSNRIYDYLDRQIKINKVDMQLFRPMPAPIDKIKNKIRWRIIIKCRFDEKIKSVMSKMLNGFYNAKYKNTNVIVDINPNNMM